MVGLKQKQAIQIATINVNGLNIAKNAPMCFKRFKIFRIQLLHCKKHMVTKTLSRSGKRSGQVKASGVQLHALIHAGLLFFLINDLMQVFSIINVTRTAGH